MNDTTSSPRSSAGDGANALLTQLSKEIGTPFWVYDAALVWRQIARLRSFDTIRYAQKANSNVNVLALMRAEGVLVDAVSEGEVDRALAAGYSNAGGDEQIVFTADLAEIATLRRLVELGIPVNCGSPDMVAQIGEVRPGHPVWLRVNPGFGHGHSRKTNTGGPSSKHGIWHEGLDEALAHVDRHGLHLVGLHMHIGSGVDYGHLSQVCDAMVRAVEQVGRPIEAISTGGGLSIPYAEGEPEVDTAHFFAAWDRARRAIEGLAGRPVRLEVEPGRFLVGAAGQLVAEVRAVKRVAGRVFVLVNAGFNDLVRPAMYGSHHTIRFLRPDGSAVEGMREPVAVAGPLCEAGDVFTQGEGGYVRFPDLPVPEVGDLAVFEDAGAYGASMSSNYNSRPLIPEVLVDGDAITLIRERQSMADLIGLERPRRLGGL